MKTVVYILVLHDRHIGTEIKIYQNKDHAVKRAREMVSTYRDYQDDWTHKAYIFYKNLNAEGDHVYVQEKEIE